MGRNLLTKHKIHQTCYQNFEVYSSRHNFVLTQPVPLLCVLFIILLPPPLDGRRLRLPQLLGLLHGLRGPVLGVLEAVKDVVCQLLKR